MNKVFEKVFKKVFEKATGEDEPVAFFRTKVLWECKWDLLTW